jgi:hypothetical protein
MARKKEPDESIIVDAAKAIGSAAGKIASLAGVAPPAEEPAPPPKTAKAKKGKLPKKNKSRLPRRQKKALKKARLNAG